MIQAAQHTDKHAIAEILQDMHRVHKDAQPSMAADKNSVESFLPKLDHVFAQNHLSHFVYKIDEKVVAYMMIAEHEHPNYLVLNPRRTIIIDVLTTHPDFRGRGIASQLINFAKELALSKGFSNIWLEVMEGLDKPKILYTKHGFNTSYYAMVCPLKGDNDG